MKKGFTLIELLVVLIILGLLAGLAGPKLFQKIGSSKSKAARIQIEMLRSALDTYALDLGEYPDTTSGLAALVTKQNSAQWDGPYLTKNVPKDPWGKDYIYRSPGEHGSFDLYTYGRDGAEGGSGEDSDIVSWE